MTECPTLDDCYADGYADGFEDAKLEHDAEFADDGTYISIRLNGGDIRRTFHMGTGASSEDICRLMCELAELHDRLREIYDGGV